jgi:hypothetical protein
MWEEAGSSQWMVKGPTLLCALNRGTHGANCGSPGGGDLEDPILLWSPLAEAARAACGSFLSKFPYKVGVK